MTCFLGRPGLRAGFALEPPATQMQNMILPLANAPPVFIPENTQALEPSGLVLEASPVSSTC